MAPPGTKIFAHEKPTQRATRRKHVVAGWYIGPELDHYSCFKLFMTEKISERISDIVDFLPQNVRMPRVSSADAATPAARYLVEALKSPTPNAPFATINETHHTALIKLA